MQDDVALEYDIQTCVELLDEEGLQSYRWTDDEDGRETYSQDGSDDSVHEALSHDFKGSNSESSQNGDSYDADAEVSPLSATNN